MCKLIPVHKTFCFNKEYVTVLRMVGNWSRDTKYRGISLNTYNMLSLLCSALFCMYYWPSLHWQLFPFLSHINLIKIDISHFAVWCYNWNNPREMRSLGITKKSSDQQPRIHYLANAPAWCTEPRLRNWKLKWYVF